MAKKIIKIANTPRTPKQLEYEKRMEENYVKILLEDYPARMEEQKKKNEEYYKQLLENDPHTLPFLLFHGTDAKMIGLSKKDRDSLFKIFHNVIDTLWPSFEPIIDRLNATGLPRPVGVALTESEEKAYKRIMHDLNILRTHKRGNQLYAYGDFYLDVSLEQAIIYAKCAAYGGELGGLAHSILEGAKILGFDIMSLGGEEFYRNAGTVLQIAEMQAEPVVFAFAHLELEKLRDMQGDLVNWVGIVGAPTQHFRYLGEVELDREHATYMRDYDRLSDLRKALKPY